MKKQLKLTLLAFLLFSIGAIAQTFPYGINYQAVARDANGNAKQYPGGVPVQFTIRKTSSSGPIIWQEKITTPATNSMGQFNTVIGSGVTTGGGSASSFSAIDWSADVHWLTVDIFNGSIYVPISSQQFQSVPYALNAKTKAPTMQIFLSGAGTYTTPANVLYIEVEMAGGGGSGGCSASSGNSTFGSSILIANGGLNGISGVNAAGGDGGTASILTPAVGISLSGGSGTGGSNSVTGSFITGGGGGNNPFGGGGGGGYGESGSSAGLGFAGKPNTGAGGGGASYANNRSAGGGGAGGYINAMITSPTSSYPYSVGQGGTCSGGGPGGSGIIIIKEYYK